MTDDNLNTLLNSTSNTQQQYENLVNRKTFWDKLGDSFTAQSMQPAINGKQRATNALMSGLGLGFSASQNGPREAKMKELEGMLKEVVDQRVKLQSQFGKQQLTKASFANYAMDNYGDFKKLNDALAANDEVAVNELMPLLYNRFSEQNPEMAKKMGKIDHVYGGKAYFDKDGKVGGVALKDIFTPLISSLPEEQQRELANLTSLTMRNKFKKTDLFEDAALSEKYANIKAHNASANQANAHADLFRAEAKGKENDALNPPKYDTKTQQHIAKENSTWVNDLRPKHKSLKLNIDIYTKLADILQQESDIMGRGGSSLFTKALRGINVASFNSESAKNQALVGLYRKHLLAGISDTFPGRISNMELDAFLTGIPDLDKDPRAAEQVAKERIAEYTNELREDEITREVLENEFKYKEPHNSLAVQKRVQEKMTIDSGNDILKKN